MKNYLILIENNNSDKILSKSDRFEYYKSWGKYLSNFNDDKLIVGSPLKEGFNLLNNGDIRKINQEEIKKGYLIIKANAIEELKNDLLGCPVFEKESSKMTIYEIDLKATI